MREWLSSLQLLHLNDGLKCNRAHTHTEHINGLFHCRHEISVKLLISIKYPELPDFMCVKIHVEKNCNAKCQTTHRSLTSFSSFLKSKVCRWMRSGQNNVEKNVTDDDARLCEQKRERERVHSVRTRPEPAITGHTLTHTHTHTHKTWHSIATDLRRRRCSFGAEFGSVVCSPSLRPTRPESESVKVACSWKFDTIVPVQFVLLSFRASSYLSLSAIVLDIGFSSDRRDRSDRCRHDKKEIPNHDWLR